MLFNKIYQYWKANKFSNCYIWKHAFIVWLLQKYISGYRKLLIMMIENIDKSNTTRAPLGWTPYQTANGSHCPIKNQSKHIHGLQISITVKDARDRTGLMSKRPFTASVLIQLCAFWLFGFNTRLANARNHERTGLLSQNDVEKTLFHFAANSGCPGCV